MDYKERLITTIKLIFLCLGLWILFAFFLPWLSKNSSGNFQFLIPNADGNNQLASDQFISEIVLPKYKIVGNVSFVCAIILMIRASVQAADVLFRNKCFMEYLGLVSGENNPFDSDSGILFVIPNKQGRNLRYVDIDISNLSKSTKSEVLKIKGNLRELYSTAKSSKRAFRTYLTYDVYLQSLADDIKKAIDECQGSEAEKILVSRLPIVIKNIDIMQRAVNDDIKYEEDVKKYKEKLYAEGYTPFATTEQMNKLLQ